MALLTGILVPLDFFASLVLALYLIKRMGVALARKFKLRLSNNLVSKILNNFNLDPWMSSVGFLLLLFTLVEYTYTFVFQRSLFHLSWYLWLSNLMPFFLSYALIFRSKTYLAFVLITSFLFENFWGVDFYGRIFFNSPPFGGIADYMSAQYDGDKIIFFSNLNHLWFLPISLWGISRINLSKNAFLVIGVWSIVINLTSFLFTLPEENINCVRKSCIFGDTVDFWINSFLKQDTHRAEFYLLAWTILINIFVFAMNKIFYKYAFRVLNKKIL